MKLFSTKALIVAALLLGSSCAYGVTNSPVVFAEDKVSVNVTIEDSFEGKQVNWEKGADSDIIVTGMGVAPERITNPTQAKLMARRAAKVDAQRNLAECLNGVQINSESTMKDLALESDVVTSKVQGVIKGASVIKEIEMPDGSFKVIMRMPMYGASGSLASVIIDQAIASAPEPAPAPLLPSVQAANEAPMSAEEILADARRQAEEIIKNAKVKADAIIAEAQAKANPAPAAPTVAVAAAPAKVTVLDKTEIQNINSSDYTGVVVDASGLGLVSTFSPVIYDVEGRPVYGMKNVDPQYAIKMGMVEYSSNLEQSKLQSRAGSNPLVLKAKAVSGGKNSINKVNVVVSVADGDKILLANEKSGMLKQCAVVFVK